MFIKDGSFLDFFVHLLFDIAVADDKTQINLRFLSFAIRKIGIELAGIANYFDICDII